MPKEEFPDCESLELTIKRTLPYWNDVIVPQVKEGKKLLIAAHGNSLRGIVKHLDNMSEGTSNKMLIIIFDTQSILERTSKKIF